MGYLARRRANQQRRVIAAMQPPGSKHFVLDLMWLLRMSSGTLYPILGRLERAGAVHSGWETPKPKGRPARRWYQLTEESAR